MKIVDTVWEEVNTGLKSCEITFDRNDNIDGYNTKHVEDRYQFSVVKIPTGNLKLVHELESIGYRYLENQFRISFEIKHPVEFKKEWSRDISGFSLSPVVNDAEFQIISDEISKGLFKNDRFTLDPMWNINVSSLRYLNWTTDMFHNQGIMFYILKSKNDNLGFFSLKPLDKKSCSCPIAGIFEKHKKFGYFFVLTLFWFREGHRLGFNKLVTNISSNNRGIHSFLCRYFPFRVDETFIVMRKMIIGSCDGQN